jgi:demethylmenaquinone methyltransferase/2-methoxy-6-polyprenyl-1,4-benzoquinol methylase
MKAHIMPENKTTHFGFSQVKQDEKDKKVGKVFHSVAKNYDLMNDLMSFGLHRLWKRHTAMATGLRYGQVALDVAGGTGDMSALLAKQVGPQGRVFLTDINPSMLSEGQNRLIDQNLLHNITLVLANAELLPFPNNHFHCVCISFGLRNVTDKAKALSAMFRTLKPGGKLLILEFSHIKQGLLKSWYEHYSFNVIPRLGGLVAHDSASYQYLVESIRMHPDQETLRQMMTQAGFERTQVMNLCHGMVALHSGYKY